MNDLAAECYRRGRDLIFGGGAVRPDLAKGVELFMVAAEKGHVEAQVFLADRCRDGLGLKKDLGRAARIYRQAAEQGDARAQHKLGMCYQFGEGVALDAETAFCWFCKAAEQRLVDAYFELGFCYLGGFGVGQDIDEAIAWFEEAAANGHVGAQHFLGRHQPYDGKLRFPELVKTATMYVLAAQQGYAVAQRGLAHLYKHGIILQKNPDQADQWLRKANGRGYSETNHEDSLGFERDVNRAFYGFEEPGSRNDSFRRLDSNGSISKRTLNGAELENDPLSPRTLVAESTDLIDFGSDTHSTGTLVTDSFVDQREARLHHSASTLSIGETDTSFGTKAPDDQFSGDGSTAQTPYARGLSAERSGNSRQAIYWYKRALDLGFTEVEFNIGRCYHDLKELDAAAKWYRKAADRGKAGAQFCLGTIYQYGSVFEKDLLQAITWYRNAAEQGHAEAQYSLGLCYEAGEGVAKDKQEAVRFFKFAAQQGHELAKKRLATLLPGPAQPSTNPLPSTITVSVPNLPASTRPPDAAGGESSRTPSSFLGSRSLFWIEEEDISIDRTQVLGRGGFGNVYAGKHLGLTDVAVKVALEKFNTEEAAALLKAEVAAWSRLPFHEHVAPLRGFRTSPTYLVTQLYKGGNLKKYLASRDWDPGVSLRLLSDTAIGLAFLHSKGIVHSDMKADNVLVDVSRSGDPTAKIADFGLAKIRTKIEDSKGNVEYRYHGMSGKTLQFAPPESFRNEPMGRPADVWAFGMMCFEVFSRGLAPYQGFHSDEAVMNAILTGKRPVRPSRVTDAVWKLMNLCWNDDPYKRPEMAFIALEMGKFADQAELERTKQQKASKASQPLREYS